MSNKATKNSKKAAYAAKQDKKEKSVINWIFGVLVALGIAYAIYSIILMS